VEYVKYVILSRSWKKTDNDEQDVNFVLYNNFVGNELVFHITGMKSDEVGIF